MKVLHLLKTSEGASWAVKQIRELILLGIDVHVVLPNYSGNALKYEEIGATIHILDMDLSIHSVLKIPYQLLSFKRLLKRIKPDLVHSHFFSTTLLMRMAMKNSKIPRIFQVPGPLHLEHFFFKSMEVAFSDRNDFWIASCQWTKKKYESLINKNRVFLSYYGTDVDFFVRGDKRYLSHELGIGGDSKIIGMVAYMYPPKGYLGQKRGLKGHEDLIDAISILLKQNHDVILVFIGGAWGKADDYEKQVMDYGKQKLGDKVFFLGTRADVSKLYSGFDIAVHPSHSENVGGAVESLLMRVPTITTHVGGFPDLIKHKITGLLADVRHPDDLAQKILYYLEHSELALQNASNGYEYARTLFDVKRTAKEIKSIYLKIMIMSEENPPR